jgi:hypothetical protein
MSIASALQNWLKNIRRNGIAADQLRPDGFRGRYSPSTYALALRNSLTKKIILGNVTHTNNYVFYAREAADEEANRAENYDFLESLSDWIEQKNADKDFPALSSPRVVNEISVSNAMLFNVEDNGLGTYQVQIQLVYSD